MNNISQHQKDKCHMSLLYRVYGNIMKLCEKMHSVLRGLTVVGRGQRGRQDRMGNHGQHIIYFYKNALTNLKSMYNEYRMKNDATTIISPFKLLSIFLQEREANHHIQL